MQVKDLVALTNEITANYAPEDEIAVFIYTPDEIKDDYESLRMTPTEEPDAVRYIIEQVEEMAHFGVTQALPEILRDAYFDDDLTPMDEDLEKN